MPTLDAETNGGLGGAARRVAEHAGAIARLELQLAALELKRKGLSLGLGIGLAAGSALFALLMVGFAWATVAAAIALVLPWWLSLLIVTAALGGLAGLLGLLAVGRLKHAAPVPEHALTEAKLTAEAIRR
jgi:Putative Actinobacterial Holin-X, holin superfamily III